MFLGETHVKDKANSDLGKQVIEKFDAYGIEGADTSKTWGGKALDVSLDVVQMAFKVFSFGKLSEGRTTGASADRDFARNLLEELKKIAEDNRRMGAPEPLSSTDHNHSITQSPFAQPFTCPAGSFIANSLAASLYLGVVGGKCNALFENFQDPFCFCDWLFALGESGN